MSVKKALLYILLGVLVAGSIIGSLVTAGVISNDEGEVAKQVVDNSAETAVTAVSIVATIDATE